ncbi:hypothetical protein CFE70_010587 [Pyrenophora teres f. teres 0-1]
MKTTSTVIAYVALLSGVLAIDFSGYSPQKGVHADFKPFLKALVTAAEDPVATTEYTDYFTKDGMQTTLSIHCVGAAAITKCKNGFLPTDGSKKLITTRGENEPPNLTPKPQGQVYWYHDYYVNPTNVPSNIPCDSEKSSTAKRDLPKREAMVTNGSRRVHVRVPNFDLLQRQNTLLEQSYNATEAHANRRSGNVGHYEINSDAAEMEHV